MVSMAVAEWVEEHGVKLEFIKPSNQSRTAPNKIARLAQSGTPNAISTRDRRLRSRFYEPFIFNSYEKA
jgi:hypothetical protein